MIHNYLKPLPLSAEEKQEADKLLDELLPPDKFKRTTVGDDLVIIAKNDRDPNQYTVDDHWRDAFTVTTKVIITIKSKQIIMKQTIEIEVPEGKKAVWKDRKVVFEDIMPELPKSWEEFCNKCKVKEFEAYIGLNSTITTAVSRRERLSDLDRSLLPSKEAAEAHLALMQLHQLRDCYRQGWIPDWNDSNQKNML